MGATSIVDISSDYDRPAQLRELESALRELVAFLEREGAYLAWVPALTANLGECERLLARTFTQDDLTALSRSFEPFVETFREWTPPRMRDAAGNLVEPAWVEGLLPLHERARRAAFALRVLGEY